MNPEKQKRKSRISLFLLFLHRILYSVHPHPFSAWGVEPPTKFSKRMCGAWQDLNFERRVAAKEEGNFFSGGIKILQKNNLQSELRNDKKRL